MRTAMHIPLIFAVSVLLVACQPKKASQQAETKTAMGGIAICAGGGINQWTDIDKAPSPTFRNGIGNSALAISTTNKEAQRWFNQGLNYLHGFWHVEAYRAFRQVIRLDATCAMGYWGLAMCQPGFGGDDNRVWEQAIDKAMLLKNTTSALEKDLIEASAILVKQGMGTTAIGKFRTLYKTYPDQPEAIALAAILLRQDGQEATQREVKTLLEKAMRRFPNHVALMHYYVHLMELRPEFGEAKRVAAQMVRLAPAIPHLTHMPGHLYFLAGDYDQAVRVYEKARTQETAYHEAEKIPFSANQNYVHNLQFLAVSQAEANNYAGALATATTLANLSLASPALNPSAATMIHYEGRILPALVSIRFRDWTKAVAHFDNLLNSLDQPINDPFVQKYVRVMRLYALGMGAIEQQQVQQATNYGAELSQLMQQYQQEGAAGPHTSAFRLINETYDIMSMARYELAGWIDNIDKAQPFNNGAWQEAISLQNAIKYDEPPRLMYPIEESRARLHKYRAEMSNYRQDKNSALLRRPKSKVIQAI